MVDKAAWGPSVDNNAHGLFVSPSSVVPTDELVHPSVFPFSLLKVDLGIQGTIFAPGALVVPTYVDPDAAFTSATVTTDSVGTFVGEAGPTDAPLMTAQFEVDITADLTLIVGQVRKQLFDSRKEITAVFQIPNGLALNNKIARFVVFAEDDAADQVFRSNAIVLTGLNWTPGLVPSSPTIRPTPSVRHVGRPGAGVFRKPTEDRT
jgi:hypothetical protein